MREPGLRPWERAGYAREEWIRGLRVVGKKHVAASNARHLFYEETEQITDPVEWLRRSAELREADETSSRIWREYVNGDPEIVGEVVDGLHQEAQ